ncbi:aspartate carbamoyltransferase [Aneurinibacillus thermoaerophilus]|uniref:Aspartate carbamoyltransferase n=1 Tax=Aneurinibacillus thermoaerophilus TaxID=143495 RepID=A0A1G7X9V3_ANETH|nr:MULTISPECIES: aspartate carbamoyltransferase [Aneurinibacillus]MED0674291.1 aspartate carbamoyltransferase [Aneurinibacillus thermoaerophilus]MED0678309.1 aspartate carbamoyltransferase [Aneurinibacillus thermoaerophilus]MED0736165.1 aspartate carbamoyltransferase [Aneurinibacillus thermoaerophilus]MED0757011.1 aspartate carbamoyltransferase [Aneurinibacillus thermoaerophilus]MED0761684.1 aspartate carbamoyltransferase [Aneurinibacillus thermoaerophilus]
MLLYHVLGAKQFTRPELDEIFVKTKEMERVVAEGGSDRYSNKVMTTLFFEPSTRTRLSFESAMSRLGGKVIGTENAAQFSSTIKGETLEDTIRVVSSYSDVIVIRHTDIGAAERAAAVATVPIINAGDGAGEHPTQSLLDLYTIKKELGRLDDLHIVMIGDLANGRTVHSLSYLLANYNKIHISFTAPENVQIPTYVKKYLDEKRVSYEEEHDLEKVAKTADVLYQTRIQKERFTSLDEYEKACGKYIIDNALLSVMKKDSIVLHPLPRAGEIAVEVDHDPRAAYFRQAENGLFVRMALIDKCFSM